MKIILSLRSIVIAVLTGGILGISLPAGAVSLNLPASGAVGRYVPGEVLVKFKRTTSADARTATVAARGHSVVAGLNQPGWTQVKVGTGQTVEAALTAYQNDPNVEYVQPNYLYHTTVTPNDTSYGQLWAFHNTGQYVSGDYVTNNPGTAGADMHIEKAWEHITDCSSVVVAIVDSGVNYNQQDLTGNMWDGGAIYPNHGYNYVNNNNDPMDLNGHGTHVAGIIGAVGNNATGTTGVCWTASIMAVRVMDATGSGTTANIISGINFAVANGAKVVNMSLGGGSFDQLFSDAITTAQNNDVVVVVAAGNDGANNNTTHAYPCNFTQPNLVCVAALDQSYELASFSNYGSTSVDIGAPGTNIKSTWAGTKTVITDSFSTGWTMTGGWATQYFYLGGVPTPFLVDPATYPSGSYGSNADDKVYKTFSLTGNTALYEAYAAINVANGDHFRVAYKSTGGDPFAGGTIESDVTNMATYPQLLYGSGDISSCISANCSIGFELQSNDSLQSKGLAIGLFSITTMALNATTYNTISGTSMATPEVAGLATMLRAYNPQYTYADTVNAIKKGGRENASLTDKTTTGKAIDVTSSLAYINPPTGLTATVH
jgi:thermitase